MYRIPTHTDRNVTFSNTRESRIWDCQVGSPCTRTSSLVYADFGLSYFEGGDNIPEKKADQSLILQTTTLVLNAIRLILELLRFDR